MNPEKVKVTSREVMATSSTENDELGRASIPSTNLVSTSAGSETKTDVNAHTRSEFEDEEEEYR